MEKFARFINDAPTPDHEPRRIKVAVLDDGFDLVDHIDEFAENNIVGKAFNGSNNQTAEEWSGRFPNVEYFSEGGHGTLMAQLIRKICPKVDFYMAKLQNTAKSPDQDGKAYGPTTESAVAVSFTLLFILYPISNIIIFISGYQLGYREPSPRDVNELDSQAA